MVVIPETCSLSISWIKETVTSDFIHGIHGTIWNEWRGGNCSPLRSVLNMTSDKQCSMNVMCFSISLSGTVTYPSNKRKFQGEMFTMQGFRPWLLFLSFSGHLRIFKLASEELRFWMWTAEKDKTCVGKWLGTSWYDLGVMALTPVDIILCRSSEGDIYVFFIETVEADMMVGRVEQ